MNASRKIDIDDWSDLDTPIDQIETKTPQEREKYPCHHCAGSGQYQGVRIHQHRGDCFACKGRGYFYTSYADRMKSREKRRAKADSKREETAEQGRNKAVEVLGDTGAEWLRTAAGWSGFYLSLLQQLEKRGDLSPGQWDCIRKGIEKQAERDAEKASRESNAPVVELTRIAALFSKAQESGLKKPRLHCNGLTLSIAPPSGRNAGCLYVKDSGDYAGKINPEGKFLATREARQEIASELQAIASDPLAALTAHGKVTGSCGCCGRELTNKESVELGIGPICREKWGI